MDPGDFFIKKIRKTKNTTELCELMRSCLGEKQYKIWLRRAAEILSGGQRLY